MHGIREKAKWQTHTANRAEKQKMPTTTYIYTQMTAPVVVCRIAGKTPAPDVAVADTRLMHVNAHKTPSISTVAGKDIS